MALQRLHVRNGGSTEVADDQANEFPALVVVGASAGGIDALSELLGPIPAGFAAPIVVAQHTQPSRESHLAEILAARTALTLVTVAKSEKLVAGHVYLVPADHHVVITDHVVEARSARGGRPSPSIDRLLASAADTFGERLIAVVLSGMGSDGVVGAGEVKSRGGTVVIQNPETAAQPSMPRALPPTLVDFVANADRMGELLTELVTASSAPPDEDDERLLSQFLERVRERTGIDFSAYKRPTVMRRLQRRMIATANPRLRDYVRYVQKHPDEYQRLSSAFLIKVTQFFRDPDLYEYLRETLVPQLIDEARGNERELRIWSAGCATGEEAYSLAILVADALGDELSTFTVRIFATDLDEEAIAFARRGRYPASAMSAVHPDLLARWFQRDGDQYEVTKEVRTLVVFGQHDLGQRAPFPRIDLTLCRNVLIYFTLELQKRSLQLFAFSLREGGYLVLGKAESSTPYAEHFVLEQPRLKVYRRAGERVLLPPARVRQTTPMPTSQASSRRQPAWAVGAGTRPRELRPPTGDRLDDLLLRMPVGMVVIDASYDIQFVNAAARRLLGIHGPAIGSDFVHLVNQVPSEELRSAVTTVLQGVPRVATRSFEVQSDDGDETTHVQLVLQPHRRDAADPVLGVVIVVLDVSDVVRDRSELEVRLDRSREDTGQLVDRMERIGRSNRELLQANEEMTNANAILRTANEELLIANEEVQAATEEVETLNEELQATNEELETLNEELQATVEELNTTNDDLESRSRELAETAASLADQRQASELERERLTIILDGMSEAVLVVDTDGRMVATNRAYDDQFGAGSALVPEDRVGHMLPEGEWPQARAARGESFSMSFTRTDPSSGERRWFEASGHPASGDWGGVIVIRDITDRSLRHLQERFIDTASHELQTPLAALHNYMQLVERSTRGVVDAETQGYVDGAIEQTRLLGELAARLFDVSLIRHGRTVVRQDTVDLRTLLDDVVRESRVVTPDQPISLRAGRRKALVRGDELRLRQALTNLLVNGTTHGASSKGVAVTLTSDDNGSRMTIADRGPGIPPALQGQLFAPFASGATDVPGLGLGLYLAREIMMEHGGSLTVEPRTGGGTVAMITLPPPGLAARGGAGRKRGKPS
jgi:two-component system, chemotaxis family, CheB/CheR fusion protein